MPLATLGEVGKLGLHIPLSPLVFWATFGVLVIIWVIFSLILRYNWTHYATSRQEIFTVNFFYYIGSAILFGVLALSAFLYHVSTVS